MKLNLMTFEFNVDRFYAQLGAFSIFTISHISDPSQQNRAVVCYQEKCDIPFIWKNILLTQKWYHFNVDRFYAQLGTFSIFVHSHDRGMKPGSNWIPWPMNLMLKDFTPNWALFLFSLFHTKEGSKVKKAARYVSSRWHSVVHFFKKFVQIL